MADQVSDNLAMLMRVVDRLGPLLDRLVFLGGAVTEFFITQPGGPGPRQTKDVDLVIDVVNLGEYSETLREQLMALGLREDTREGAPVCRWLLETVDRRSSPMSPQPGSTCGPRSPRGSKDCSRCPTRRT